VHIPALLAALDSDDADGARQLAVQAGDIAARFGDADLAALSTLAHGQALLALGKEEAGLARLDEVMLAVCAGDVGPIVSGIVYCAVILECLQIFDLARAAEWTAALDEWCRAQPDLVPYRGQCLVHRSQLRQAAGDWAGAVVTVADARDRLSDPPHPALGLAYYQEGELAGCAVTSMPRPMRIGGPAGPVTNRSPGWHCCSCSEVSCAGCDGGSRSPEGRESRRHRKRPEGGRCRGTPASGSRDTAVERVTGIEPAQSAWKARDSKGHIGWSAPKSGRCRAFRVPQRQDGVGRAAPRCCLARLPVECRGSRTQLQPRRAADAAGVPRP
jgi:hypothetical protein